MFDAQDRRSMLRKLASGASAAGVAMKKLRSPADAAAEEAGTERREPIPFVWRGKAASVALRHHESGEKDHYRAEVRIRNGVSMLDRSGNPEQKSDYQIHRLLLKRGGRGMDGRNTLVIKDTSYALMQSDHDPESGMWSLELRRYSGAEPKVTGEDDQFQDLTGCGCGCNKCCYRCQSGGYITKPWFCGVCGRKYC